MPIPFPRDTSAKPGATFSRALTLPAGAALTSLLLGTLGAPIVQFLGAALLLLAACSLAHAGDRYAVGIMDESLREPHNPIRCPRTVPVRLTGTAVVRPAA